MHSNFELHTQANQSSNLLARRRYLAILKRHPKKSVYHSVQKNIYYNYSMPKHVSLNGILTFLKLATNLGDAKINCIRNTK